MKPPKYRYEIKREKGHLKFPHESTSFPEFEERVKGFIDYLGDDEVEEDTIIIRKSKI